MENEIQRALLIAGDNDRLGPDVLSEMVRGEVTDEEGITVSQSGDLKAAQARLETEMIGQALKRHKGNRTHAARALGVSRWGLVQKIQKYGIG